MAKACAVCGGDLPDGSKKTYHDGECALRRTMDREEKRRAGLAASSVRKCDVCGEEYDKRERGGRRYCGDPVCVAKGLANAVERKRLARKNATAARLAAKAKNANAPASTRPDDSL